MAEFGENPFLSLKLPTAPHVSADNSALTAADSELFRKAYANLEARRTNVSKSGFRIEEQCKLPKIVKKKPEPASRPKPGPPAYMRPQEDEFSVAMRNVRPISARGRAIAPRPELRPAQILHEATLEDFMAGKLEFAVSGTGEYLEGYVVGLDELVLNRLREGQFSPEAHYDLHGLNSEQAFESLKEFIHSSWLKDLRSVLVITGRGKNSPAGQSVLRQKLQTWLTREPFKRIVLAFCTARPNDGGPGSIYILLRRFRKKGPVLWQRQFVESDVD